MLMILDNVDPYSDKLQSLEQLRTAIEIGMDIQIKINGIEWYIGYDQNGKQIVAQNSDGPVHYFKSDNDPDEVLDYVIGGKKIRDQWRDIVVVAM